ncbi:glycosyltransferase [Nocardioides cavernaquae]|uniref:glycosyltransferase n=1 Tax=Nocardioides cavernaquae TaxID=2321396 RepID=UPI0015FFD94A|nr:glycosyltransferase [Nocardioides cavernaquae]
MANELTRRARRVARRAINRVQSGQDPVHASLKVLASSTLFDLDWYNLQLERGASPLDRRQAIRHYLSTGRSGGLTPHPLVDPTFLAEQLSLEDDRDPLTVYLQRRRWRYRTHPLFRVGPYVAKFPAARDHRDGPIGHYVEVGAPAGAHANEWLPVDDDGRQPDLCAWLRERLVEWRERESPMAPDLVRQAPGPEADAARARLAGVRPAPSTSGPLVSVAIIGGYVPERLADTLRSVAAQTEVSWEAFVLVEDASLAALALEEVPGQRVTVLEVGQNVGLGVREAVERATGEYAAVITAGETWSADRLRLAVAAARSGGADLVADVLKVERGDSIRYGAARLAGGRVVSRQTIDISRVVARRDLVASAAIDWSQDIWAWLLVTALTDHSRVEYLPVVGTTRDQSVRMRALRPLRRWQRLRYAPLDTAPDRALRDRLIDWSEIEERTPEADVVSVLIPTYRDWRMTTDAVAALAQTETDLEIDCIVHDDGGDAMSAVILDSLPLRFPGVRVMHDNINRGFAMANNLAFAHARGAVVVLLNNDTEVEPGWLTPLVSALEDPQVLGVQSLLLFPTGTIQSAGVAFPSCVGIPHEFLGGFPREDAEGIEQLRFHALTGAALAVRHADLTAVRGLDPIYRNGMEDIDLCLRLADVREGHFVVRPDSVVIHHESRSEGRFKKSRQNRAVLLEQWRDRLPADDVKLWGTRGFTVVDHEVVHHRDEIGSVGAPSPVLVRTDRLPGRAQVSEAPPRLRWSIKNPAPAGKAGEHWGDTHFARAVAGALRELGQQVVIDARPEFYRSSGRHDDVNLVLQGLAPYQPFAESVNLVWVISHPERFHAAQAHYFDRVLAASVSWAEQTSREWGRRVEPLLQATDPESFHPDRAVPDTGHPVLFVGSSRNVSRPIVADAVEQGLPLSIYGGQWKEFVHKRYIKGEYLPNADLGAAYRSAGVVLNDHWEDMRVEGFVSNRLFDAAASGARVITDDVAGLGDTFGNLVQVYRTPEDLVRLSSMVNPDEVFGDDAYRREVAARIAREHSFHARAERLVEVAIEERKRRGFSL